MNPLSGQYYVKCNAVFRRSTNQAKLMLDEMRAHVKDRAELRILSVGAGAGLFEIPMLEMMKGKVTRFVGVDVNEHACQLLISKLDEGFAGSMDYEVAYQSFQNYQTKRRFEIVLFNHTFEYLDGDRLSWIQKSRELMSSEGNVLIFSPNRGGINKYYGEVFTPCFSKDLAHLLNTIGMSHSTAQIDAECDVSLLASNNENPDKICLLSFLTQIDCRKLSSTIQEEYVEYFLSLQNGEAGTIPHPTTLFVL